MSALKVAKGLVVYIRYSILDANGNVAEQYDMPIGYVHGGNSGLLEKLESALTGKSVGDRVEVVLPPEDAYGPRDEDLTFTDDIENVPPQFRHLGAEVVMSNEAGETKAFYVSRIENGRLTVDGNNPLAGQQVTCMVDVVDIREATEQEKATGMAADSPPRTLIH
ncbi:MAG: FKBP-type peptidyl-prolyl cis-trans isomerase [Thiobacillaceae bacterium]|jgi:FKBP-type peptidyl-prolyl cis-trans isomerase SlyD